MLIRKAAELHNIQQAEKSNREAKVQVEQDPMGAKAKATKDTRLKKMRQ